VEHNIKILSVPLKKYITGIITNILTQIDETMIFEASRNLKQLFTTCIIIQDFDIQWLWAFESGRDAEDTLLGTDGGTAKLGVYITVVREDVNIDTDGDGILDGNIDTDGDGEPDINIDTDGDGKPDINIDTDGDGKPNINIDTDGDGIPDINIDTDGDGIADINIDIDGDGRADLNIDTDGDGIPDLNVDEDGDRLVDIAVQPQAPTTGDGSPSASVHQRAVFRKNIKSHRDLHDFLFL